MLFRSGITADQTVKEYYSDPTNVHNRGQFRAGAANRRNHHIQFPYDAGPILVFQYAVIAHWVMPTDLDPSDIPGSFPLSANADEPIYMEIVDDNSNLWHTGSAGGGKISLDVEIFDQGAAHNPGGVLGEISSLILEFDDPALNPLPAGFVSFPSSELTAATGSSDISSVVTVEVDNCEPKGLSTGNLILTVESSDPTTFDPGTGDPPTNAKLAGYSYFDYELSVGNQIPFAEPVTDLSLKVNRVATGTAFESLELDWTDTNGEEYAVYQDSDPYDNGGVINIDYSTPVLLVPGSPAVISTFDHNGAYVFTVRVRKIAGDPGSESTDSNWALVELDDGGSETDPGNWLMGGNAIYYGQMRMSRGATSGNNGGWGYFVDNGLWANACMVMWSSLSTPQVPEIPGATESFVEWAHNYYDCWKAATFPGCTYPDNYPGFTGGGATAPAPEPVGYADPGLTWMEYDVFYDSPDDPPGGFGDPATHIGYNNISIYGIFGTPTTSAIWHGTDTTWKISRVNAGIISDDFDYAAVTCSTYSSLNNWSADEGHYYMDDLAVVVY